MRPLTLAASLALLLTACSGASPAIATPDEPPDDAPLDPASKEAPPRDVPQNAFAGTSQGCSNLIAFRGTADGTQYAVVELDAAKLALAVGETKTVDLGTDPEGVAVFVDVYARALEGAQYCSDARTEEPASTRWSAEAGKLTIALTADRPAGDAAPPTYRATLRLETVHFTSPEGGFAVVVPSVLIEDVRVGWLPG
ncbi:MAG: hypothetical protein KF764_30940 [Labilithrix sp.]|nr:hypothetical protein [Labilithrix sp.]